jgi:hypothetical protein
MPKPPRPMICLPLLVALLLASGPALAQDEPPARNLRSSSSSFDRLFLSFIEDATMVDRQWWEIQGEFSDGDVIDSSLLRGVVVFQPWNDVELGARLGFGNTDTPRPLPEGRGATDMDLFGKYYLDNPEGKVDLAVGVQLRVPTGDNTSGLGFDAFALGFFGSLRWRISDLVTLSGNAGFQINEDGETLGGPELDGKTSERLGAGVIFHLSKRLNLLGEWSWAGERFEGTDNDSRLLAGVNWRMGRIGVLRGAVAGGVSDGAPDTQFLVAYAWQFP